MPRWFTHPLAEGDTGDAVRIVQRKVDATITGVFDDETAARVRGVQLRRGLPLTGVVDEATAEVLGEKPDAGRVPDWFPGPPPGGMTEAQVRRFQSERGLPLTGVVDEATAVALGDLSY